MSSGFGVGAADAAKSDVLALWQETFRGAPEAVREPVRALVERSAGEVIERFYEHMHDP